MPTTIHTPIRGTLTAGERSLFATDVAAGQATRSFFQVSVFGMGLLRLELYAQAPTNTTDRTLNVFDKGGGFGRQIVFTTDPATPVQVAAGQSLLVYVTNLEDVAQDVLGFINGNF